MTPRDGYICEWVECLHAGVPRDAHAGKNFARHPLTRKKTRTSVAACAMAEEFKGQVCERKTRVGKVYRMIRRKTALICSQRSQRCQRRSWLPCPLDPHRSPPGIHSHSSKVSFDSLEGPHAHASAEVETHTEIRRAAAAANGYQLCGGSLRARVGSAATCV